MLDLTKKYRTRDGQSVEKITTYHEVTLQSGIVYKVNDNGLRFDCFRGSENPHDLIEVSVVRVATMFMNNQVVNYNDREHSDFDQVVFNYKAIGWVVEIHEVEVPWP
jgi:hypothetical protein